MRAGTVAARPRRDPRHACGQRHRHRADRGAARAAVPAVRAGRIPRPRAASAAPGLGFRSCGGWRELMGGKVDDRKHAGRGLDLHGDADAEGGAGRFAARRAAAAGARRPKPAAATRPRSERLRVLVVDDHPVNREVLVRQLDLLGLAADSVNDGVEALEAWAAGRYTAVLADIHMPRMDGYELTRRIRAAEAEGRKTGRTPIVAVTANAMKGEEERCIDAGMDAYLVKPVSIERLRATLERWLSVDRGGNGHDAGQRRARRERDRSQRAGRLARRRSRRDRIRCSASSATPRSRRSARSTAPRATAISQRSLPPPTSSRARRMRSAPRASAPPPPRSNRPARPATAPAAATGLGPLAVRAAPRAGRDRQSRGSASRSEAPESKRAYGRNRSAPIDV